jgi:hypothetical protein
MRSLKIKAGPTETASEKNIDGTIGHFHTPNDAASPVCDKTVEIPETMTYSPIF